MAEQSATFATSHTSTAPQAQVNDRMLRWFEYGHLKPEMQEVSRVFHAMAHHLVSILPPGPERTVALRKLLEAKDCAVRAFIEGQG